MNKEIYKALDNIIKFVHGKTKELRNNDINIAEEWIREIAKEYNPNRTT